LQFSTLLARNDDFDDDDDSQSLFRSRKTTSLIARLSGIPERGWKDGRVLFHPGDETRC
jgi:hypothetical protein